MIQRRERPRCRKVIEGLLKQRNCSLDDLIEGDNKYQISQGLRIEVRKMIEERDANDRVVRRSSPATA